MKPITTGHRSVSTNTRQANFPLNMTKQRNQTNHLYHLTKHRADRILEISLTQKLLMHPAFLQFQRSFLQTDRILTYTSGFCQVPLLHSLDTENSAEVQKGLSVSNFLVFSVSSLGLSYLLLPMSLDTFRVSRLYCAVQALKLCKYAFKLRSFLISLWTTIPLGHLQGPQAGQKR